MRIAYFTDTYTPEVNGVANTLAKLSDYLGQNQMEHAIFAPDYGTKVKAAQEACGAFRQLYRFPGVRVSLSPNSCLALPTTKAVFDLCDEFAPELVHVTTEFGIGYKGIKYAMARRLPLITSYHTDYCSYLDYFNLQSLLPMVERYLKWFHGFAQKTLVPSNHTLKALKQQNFQNLDIWSRGIDADKFNIAFRSHEVRKALGIGDKFAFLYVGRLSPEKGLHMLLHAIGQINARFPGQAVFVFTGDGPYAETIRRAGFENTVLTGFRSGQELAEIYASCDCFAFPSGSETFGNAPLEAMASGLPVVGVSSGGVTDFLHHGKNALLFADGDEGAFTEHLIRLMQNPALRGALAADALKTALSRDWDEIFEGLLNEYHTAIARHGVGAGRRAS